VAHVHDEIVAEGDQDIKEMEAIMSEPIPGRLVCPCGRTASRRNSIERI